MLGFVYILLTAFVVFKSSFGQISCDKDIHENCPESEFLSDDKYLQIFSEQEIPRVCSYATTYINCTQAYLNACENSEDQEYFRLLTGSLSEFLNEFCDETSQLRMEYKKHVSCVRETNNIEPCVLEAMATSMESLEGDSTEPKLPGVCGLYEQFKSCMRSRAEEQCGIEASDFIEMFLTKPVESLWNEKC